MRDARFLALPFLAALAFTLSYSSPFPLTDEWNFTKAIVALHDVELHSLDDVPALLDAVPARFHVHRVIVPFLFYWPIVEITRFDSRWIIGITLIAFAVQALLFHRHIFRGSVWAWPVALLFFCPSHYMEFLWGWQFTLALSIVFPIAGLVVLHRAQADAPWRTQAPRLLAGLVLILLGALSSAGGYFGFPCALILVALQPARPRVRLARIGAIGAATILVVLFLADSAGQSTSVGLRHAVSALTALGGTIWGTPVGTFEFGFDLASVTGGVIVICVALVVLRGLQKRLMGKLALALCITLFGLLCTASIAMARSALGNWHLQFSLAAVAGAYGAAFVLWRNDRTRLSTGVFAVMAVTVTSCLYGWYAGFTRHGPAFAAYIRQVEDHSRGFLADPHAAQPHPPAMAVNADMMLFLSARDHALFRDPAREGPGSVRPRRLPLPESSRAYVDALEVGRPLEIEVAAGRMPRLTVAVPAHAGAARVSARIGGADLVLRRIHPTLTQVTDCQDPAFACFAGLVLERATGSGTHGVRFAFEH